MARTILISIRPRWVEKIASGEKRAELRKMLPAWSGRMWVYETAPVKAIVGSMDIEKVERLPMAELWEAVKDASCVGREEFLAYYKDAMEGYAAWIAGWHPLQKPIRLSELGLKLPPQSWQWIEEDVLLQAAGLKPVAKADIDAYA